MKLFKKSYFYNPRLQKDDLGYSVDIYEHRGKKSTVIYTYTDPDYRKVLFFARCYVYNMTKCQK